MSTTPVDAAATPQQPADNKILERFMWLSIATAIATVVLKGVAAWITGSVGMFSDALESTVNLAAAIVALWAIRLAAKPADHNHDYGHGKAEYLSAAVEGMLIFVAAGAIIYGAVGRLFHPEPLEELGLGLILSTVASLLNLATGLALLNYGRKHRSITLEADGKHLLTDVWTSVGVLVAIGLVALTGWLIVDPIIAIAVGINILWTGYSLVRRSVVGLLDAALPAEEVALVRDALNVEAENEHVTVTDLKTRESGRQRFIEATIEVPGDWTVEEAHTVADRIEDVIDQTLPGTVTVVHVEPIGASVRDGAEPSATTG
ncbi:MAG: cation diffusion facilitator family transporter [Propionibacteriaceae bacterium]|nr:cation transporter [Micropruina sp.]MBK9158290.1 cation transporter [Micropruina sp.]HBX82702.1 cation-efflux pump [Propionibacteriaceae bacterium]